MTEQNRIGALQVTTMSDRELAVSIVIPCYNYQRYVGTAIESALSQSYSPIEVIVVDDGSIDDSWAVIAGFGGKIRALKQENQGVVAASYNGFIATKGDIILILDADDALYDDAIASVVKVWQAETAKVQFDLDIIDADGNRLGRRFCNFKRDIFPDETRRRFLDKGTYRWPVTSGNAYSRSFFLQLSRETPPINYDGMLNTVAPIYGDVHTIGRPLGQYRLHGSNMSFVRYKQQSTSVPDFGKAIQIRKEEFRLMSKHAEMKGVSLPEKDFLGQEIVFVNYQLMAHKMGLQPQLQGLKTVNLFAQGLYLCTELQEGVVRALSHMIWLALLAMAPRALASRLVVLRFNRAAIKRRIWEKFLG